MTLYNTLVRLTPRPTSGPSLLSLIDEFLRRVGARTARLGTSSVPGGCYGPEVRIYVVEY